MANLGPFSLNSVTQGDCLELLPRLPEASVDVLVTSPPYWGQRTSSGTGTEKDPRDYLTFLEHVFLSFLPRLKPRGIVWINLGDAFNTPVNWRLGDCRYSTLGAHGTGLAEHNSAYVKPRARRKACIDREAGWLNYGNLLALPQRLIIALSSKGYWYRGEVIWRKRNPLPEGRCRRPHRQHEPVFLLARDADHAFRVEPPVGSVWEFASERIEGPAHFSRFPLELARRCIESYGRIARETIVLDPFSGSGTTGLAALSLGCAYLGFEIDPGQVAASNQRLLALGAAHHIRSSGTT